MEEATTAQASVEVKRPTGVTVMAWIFGLWGGAQLMGGGLVALGSQIDEEIRNEIFATSGDLPAWVYLAILFGATYLILSWGLLKMRGWARATLLPLAVVSATWQMGGALSGSSEGRTIVDWLAAFGGMVLMVWVILYLMRRNVREAFRAASPGEPVEPTMI